MKYLLLMTLLFSCNSYDPIDEYNKREKEREDKIKAYVDAHPNAEITCTQNGTVIFYGYILGPVTTYNSDNTKFFFNKEGQKVTILDPNKNIGCVVVR